MRQLRRLGRSVAAGVPGKTCPERWGTRLWGEGSLAFATSPGSTSASTSRSGQTGNAPRRAGRSPQQQRTKEEVLWELIAYNTRSFNPPKLPGILVGLVGLPAQDRRNEKVGAFLSGALAALRHEGSPVRLFGISGAVTSIAHARRLQLPQGNALATLLLSALAMDAQLLRPEALLELAQEVLRLRISDATIWKAMAKGVLAIDSLAPATLVALLNAFRHALAFGFREDTLFLKFSQLASASASTLSTDQLVGAFSSFCRLGNHISKAEQHSVLQRLLDHWLAAQVPGWESTPAPHVIRLAVSLTNISDFLGSGRALRSEIFVKSASKWTLDTALPAGALTTEELVVLLWAIKELTPLGLGPHRELLEAVLPKLHEEEGNFAGYSILRLVQASEVLLASRHALGQIDDVLVDMVGSALSKGVAQKCPLDLLTRIVALWDQAGATFWTRSPELVSAIVAQALALVADHSLKTADVGILLDTLSAATFSRTEEYLNNQARLHAAALERPDAAEPSLSAAVQRLARGSSSSTSGGPGAGAAAASGPEERDDPSQPMPEVLHPADMAERVVKLCKRKDTEEELAAAVETLLDMLDTVPAAEALPLLEKLVTGARRYLGRRPVLVDVVERLGDTIVEHARELSVLQLTAALELFANAGLPYHLLFEAVLAEVLERLRHQSVSWSQAVGVLEGFAAVRLRVAELVELCTHLRQPRELARLPTTALVRFLSAASRLDLVEQAGVDVREIMDRVLAETTPERPLPLESSVVLVQSLLLSGTVLPDRQLRHLLAWVSATEMPQLTPQHLAILRLYSLFLLGQPDDHARGSLYRLPVEVQRFLSALLRHPAPTWAPSASDTTRRFRQEVEVLLTSEDNKPTTIPGPETDLGLGPAGSVDLRLGNTCWLLDGPEAFFRPFVTELKRTPQEVRRGWLLSRLLGDVEARRAVTDFFPAAANWPELTDVRRLHWLEWGQTDARTKLTLVGPEA